MNAKREKDVATFTPAPGPGPCCFAHLEGRNARGAYGADVIDVVVYGDRTWPSACWYLALAPATS